MPLALGAKPKQSLESKLQHLLSNVPRNSLSNRQQATGQILFSANSIPSTLAASYIQLSRRFLAGKQPANALEQQVFAALSTLSPDLRGVLSCIVNSSTLFPQASGMGCSSQP